MSGGEQLMVANWKSARQAELLIWQEVIEKGAVLHAFSGPESIPEGQTGSTRGPVPLPSSPGPGGARPEEITTSLCPVLFKTLTPLILPVHRDSLAARGGST